MGMQGYPLIILRIPNLLRIKVERSMLVNYAIPEHRIPYLHLTLACCATQFKHCALSCTY